MVDHYRAHDSPSRELPEHAPEYLRPVNSKVLRYFSDDGGEGTDSQVGMIRDRDVVFAVHVRGKPQVTAGFSRNLIPETLEVFGKLTPREIAG